MRKFRFPYAEPLSTAGASGYSLWHNPCSPSMPAPRSAAESTNTASASATAGQPTMPVTAAQPTSGGADPQPRPPRCSRRCSVEQQVNHDIIGDVFAYLVQLRAWTAPRRSDFRNTARWIRGSRSGFPAAPSPASPPSPPAPDERTPCRRSWPAPAGSAYRRSCRAAPPACRWKRPWR